MPETDRLYPLFRERARRIAAGLPQPDFYRLEPAALGISRERLAADPLVSSVRGCVTGHLEDDFGHGMLHATKVAVDAGALMEIEGRAAGWGGGFRLRRVGIVQCAALLHDIRRKRRNHAAHGADLARELLAGFPLSAPEIEDICIAIRNHEAFKPAAAVDTPEGAAVCGCLYDADKFRWGPDNFTDTLWAMVSFSPPPVSEFLGRYPKGMESLRAIKATFRTAAGRRYGPQFIDQGLAIGQELYRVITTEFAAHL
jgi:hypothetical protein